MKGILTVLAIMAVVMIPSFIEIMFAEKQEAEEEYVPDLR